MQDLIENLFFKPIQRCDNLTNLTGGNKLHIKF